MPTDRLSATFAALADPTRRAILARLLSSECSVTELAEPFDMSMPAVSKHLRVLERTTAGIPLAALVATDRRIHGLCGIQSVGSTTSAVSSLRIAASYLL